MPETSLQKAPDPFELAARRFERRGSAQYLYNPLGWIDRFVKFPVTSDGPGALTPYQRESINDLVIARRVAVRGPHGLGKTTSNALVILWFALSREDARIDWKIITTAGVWRQLEVYLWPEIHKWAGLLDWEALGRAPFDPIHELQTLNLKLHHGAATAVASSKKELIEGAHADSILYVFDEGKAIDADIFDAAEGAFSGAREQGLPEAFGLAQSTPGDTSGRFYDIHRRAPGLDDWKVRHVTLSECIAAGRVSPTWANNRAKQWGIDSAVYANRVLGEFHSSDEDTTVPLAWVEAAIERWHMWEEQGKPVLDGRRVVGVDVARGGGDLTVIADRIGPIVYPLTRMDVADTMKVAKATARRMPNRTDLAVIDVIGIGAGVVDYLRMKKVHNIHAFNAARKTSMRDRSGEFGFVNQRAAMWWTMREMLDPTFGPTLALPDDDDLIGELTSPRWWVTPSGKIQVESKDEVRKRIGRSTDSADPVCQSLLTDTEFNQVESTEPDAYAYADSPSASQGSNTDAYSWE
jgi:hypothetical protein